LETEFKDKQKASESEDKPGYKEALTGDKYWRATWFCMLIAFFN
jgi:hypothetical protein